MAPEPQVRRTDEIGQACVAALGEGPQTTLGPGESLVVATRLLQNLGDLQVVMCAREIVGHHRDEGVEVTGGVRQSLHHCRDSEPVVVVSALVARPERGNA